MQKTKIKSKGFLNLLSLFTIFAALLWYFQIDVHGFVDSHPEIKNTLSILWKYAAEFATEIKEWF